MKSNWDICHAWANNLRESDRNNNIFYTSDGCIYSYGYHFCMGRIIDGVLYYTLERYSVTTAKHQGYMRGAWGGPAIACAVQGAKGSYYYSYSHVFDIWSDEFKAANFDAWRAEIDALLPSLNKARKPEKYQNEIARICQLARDFAHATGAKLPAYFRKFATAETASKVAEFARIQAEKAARKAAKDAAKKEADFQSFKIGSYISDFQTVRYNKTSERFETSKGVQIPFEIGRRFYQALKEGTLQTGTKVLYYTINSIGSTLKIGCHTFKRAYLLKYGKMMFETV